MISSRYLPALFVAGLLLTQLLGGCASAPRSVPPYTGTMYGSRVPATQRPYRVGRTCYYPLPSAQGFVQVGYASWYGKKFHGRYTANGERYNMYEFTAAHRTLPMNTRVLVQNLRNGKSVVVRINDRGPFVKNRIIDLSYAAARRIGLVGPGTAKVRVVALAEGRYSGGKICYKKHPNLKKGRFYLQVGAFENRSNAYRLRDRLARIYPDVRVFVCTLRNRVFYRVQLYASDDYDRARDIEARMERRGFKEAFLVAR